MKKVESLYLHFPYCQHLCNYCDFYKHKLESIEQINDFESLLLAQSKVHKQYLSQNGFSLSQLETLYIGGGTPTLWKLKGPEFLKQFFINNDITFKENYEFTIEVDPDTWTEEEIESWLKLGVNRFSIGSQAFSDKFIDIMDRTHALADVEKTIKYFSDRKLNYSVDLMLGLPFSEQRDIRSELNNLLRFNPDHLSVYILKARSKYPLIESIPDDDIIREEYLLVSKILRENDFEHYEVSNFAKDKKYSQHNLKYWNYDSVAAMGPNATGLLVKGENSLRYHWKSKAIGHVDEKIEGESLIIEKLFLNLRNFKGLKLAQVLPEHANITEIEKKIFNLWKSKNYLSENSRSDHIILNSLGYLMSDSLMDDLFKFLDF